MAKTAHMIDLDYQKALRQADRLDEAVKDIKRERTKLKECRTRISSAWKGENATAYLKKVQIVENDLATMEKNIRDTAATIRKIAKTTYEAEKKALALAKARTV